ncbi:Trypsin [Methylocapsa palsarum]|uniref:Trypsin n=2 Tax=Methylocapsa palsarum TaxID=1612308 RepID=A0A1I3X088_9HYPH|nr:Trypsin [Methylocapsa palsarum]
MNVAAHVAANVAAPKENLTAASRRQLILERLLALVCLAAPFLAAALMTGTAAALVGPARLAPELEPYVVTVLNRSGDSSGFCTGSVISPTVVLTAAHCVGAPDDTRIFFKDAKGAPVLVETAAVAINPGFRPDAIRRRITSIDLALVLLAEPLPSAFTPVEIAKGALPTPGQKFLIAGFGVADEAQGKTGGILRSGILVDTGPKSSVLLWAADPARSGLGACTGDSGAPLLSFDRPAVVAVAVWAKGQGGNHCGALTQAVLVAPQRHWIETTMNAWSAAAR